MQKKWRITGAAAVLVAAIMAWYGASSLQSTLSPLYLFLYWSVFLVCLIVAFYCVLLDIRFIRLQFALDRQRIFRETVGNQEFRRALNAAQAQRARESAREEDSTVAGPSAGNGEPR